jgi:hypothetical protein
LAICAPVGNHSATYFTAQSSILMKTNTLLGLTMSRAIGRFHIGALAAHTPRTIAGLSPTLLRRGDQPIKRKSFKMFGYSFVP